MVSMDKSLLEQHRQQQRYTLALGLWLISIDNRGLADLSMVDRKTLRHLIWSGSRSERIAIQLSAVARIAQALRADVTLRLTNRFLQFREITLQAEVPLSLQVLDLLPAERFADLERAKRILAADDLELEILFDCAEIAGYVPNIVIEYENKIVPHPEFPHCEDTLLACFRSAQCV